MINRPLHLAAYDVADPGRLHQALYILRDYSTGGQKSVFECFLSPAERQELLQRMGDIMDMDEDRFLLLRLDAGSRVRTLGLAVEPVDPEFFYIG